MIFRGMSWFCDASFLIFSTYFGSWLSPLETDMSAASHAGMAEKRSKVCPARNQVKWTISPLSSCQAVVSIPSATRW